MAESIYTQLEKQEILTPVNGTDYTHPLPQDLFPSDKQFEDKEALLAWAEENDFTFPLIQKGLQKAIIEVRACFKSCKKTESWNEDLGLANLEEMVWKIVDRPETAKSNEDKAIDALSKLSPEKIAELLAKLQA
jgi:hypothetical protein